MASLTDELNARLAALRQKGLYRELRRVDSPQSTRLQLAGQSLLNFSSNDYLGLANHPALRAAAVQAVERYGVGSGASRSERRQRDDEDCQARGGCSPQATGRAAWPGARLSDFRARLQASVFHIRLMVRQTQ